MWILTYNYIIQSHDRIVGKAFIVGTHSRRDENACLLQTIPLPLRLHLVVFNRSEDVCD